MCVLSKVLGAKQSFLEGFKAPEYRYRRAQGRIRWVPEGESFRFQALTLGKSAASCGGHSSDICSRTYALAQRRTVQPHGIEMPYA